MVIKALDAQRYTETTNGVKRAFFVFDNDPLGEVESTMSHQHKEPNLAGNDIEKLKILLPHWIDHNAHHIQEREKWLKTVEDLGFDDVANELRASIEVAREENRRLLAANDRLQHVLAHKQS